MPRVSTDQLAARRQQILDGARSCFSRHGYEGATVRRLEQATGLSRGAIFHHFRDKDALFFALAEQDAQRMVDVVAEQGLVQVMRELLASPESLESGWTGTFLEIARRSRTDPGFRERWRERSGGAGGGDPRPAGAPGRGRRAAHRRAGRGAGQLPGAGAGRAGLAAGHRRRRTATTRAPSTPCSTWWRARSGSADRLAAAPADAAVDAAPDRSVDESPPASSLPSANWVRYSSA